MFFPSRKGTSPTRVFRETREYCSTCPVKADCLEAAIREERRYPEGMRGGKTPPDRKRIYLDRVQQQRLNKENGHFRPIN